MKKRAIILFSGGLDSTTCLAIAQQAGYDCYTLNFDYGQRHRVEIEQAQQLAKHFKVAEHKTFCLPIDQFGGSALTDHDIALPDFKENGEIPITYVPGRNTIFLSIALAYAEVKQASAIFVGISSVDSSGYPDARPEYLEAFQKLALLATKSGVKGQSLEIQAPLIHLSKAETIQLGLSLGVDYSLTVSCYQADNEGRACGTCDSCGLRKRGFIEAGVADPTLYRL